MSDKPLPHWYVIIYEHPEEIDRYVVSYVHDGPGKHETSGREQVPAMVEAAIQLAKEAENTV